MELSFLLYDLQYLQYRLLSFLKLLDRFLHSVNIMLEEKSKKKYLNEYKYFVLTNVLQIENIEKLTEYRNVTIPTISILGQSA